MDNIYESGIGIFPNVIKTSFRKGDIKKFILTVENYHDIPITVTGHGGSFAQNPDTLLNYLENTDSYEEWLTFKKTTLKPNSQTEIELKLSIPKDFSVSEGSYYPALILDFDVPHKEEGTVVRFEHAIPIYVEITENSVAEIDVRTFKANQIILGSRVEFDIQLSNDGNTFSTPLGFQEFHKLSPLNGSDKTRIETLAFNLRQTTILPQSRYTETAIWERDEFGHYESTLYVQAGDESIPVETIDFWIVPTRLVMIISLAAALIAAFIFVKLLRRKKHKKTKPERKRRFKFPFKRKDG